MSDNKMLEIRLDTWRRLKTQSVKEESSMKDIIDRALEFYLDAHTRMMQGSAPGTPTMKKLAEITDALEGAYEIDQRSLSTTIGRIAGEDSRTVSKYIKLLIKYRYMVPTAPHVYRMNLHGEAGRAMQEKVRDWMVG